MQAEYKCVLGKLTLVTVYVMFNSGALPHVHAHVNNTEPYALMCAFW